MEKQRHLSIIGTKIDEEGNVYTHLHLEFDGDAFAIIDKNGVVSVYHDHEVMMAVARVSDFEDINIYNY